MTDWVRCHWYLCHFYLARDTSATDVDTDRVYDMEASYLHLHPHLLAFRLVLSSSRLVVIGALLARVGSTRHWDASVYQHSNSAGSSSCARGFSVRELHQQRSPPKTKDQSPPVTSNRAEGSHGLARRALYVALLLHSSVFGQGVRL